MEGTPSTAHDTPPCAGVNDKIKLFAAVVLVQYAAVRAEDRHTAVGCAPNLFRGQVRFNSTTPSSHLNACPLRPVNVYRSSIPGSGVNRATSLRPPTRPSRP